MPFPMNLLTDMAILQSYSEAESVYIWVKLTTNLIGGRKLLMSGNSKITNEARF